MDFDFSGSNEKAFDEARDQFLDDLTNWAAAQRSVSVDWLRAPAATFLTWNFGFRGQSLAGLTRQDISDYLLGWAPRRHRGGSEDAPALCGAVQAIVEYLAANGQLDNGFERAASLMSHVQDISDEVAVAMGAKLNFGTSKSLLSAPLTNDSGEALPDLAELLESEDLTTGELQALLDERMEAFNSLPIDERKRITDTPELRGDPIPLPFAYIPPHPAEVEATASFADIVRMVDGFVGYAGDHGIALTEAGNIAMKDARILVAELETGDSLDRGGGTHAVTSSLELRWLTLVDDLATELGAVQRLKTRIKADGGWFDASATEKAKQLGDVILRAGFLSASDDTRLLELRQLLDDGVPHWLLEGLLEGNALPVAEIVDVALEVTAVQPGSQRSELGAEVFDRLVSSLVAELFEGLERFGLLIWSDATSTPSTSGGSEIRSGGTLTLTPLGRYVLPDHVEEAGYSFETIEGIEEASAAQMVEIAWTSGLTGSEIVGSWKSDLPLIERAQAVADHVMTGDSVDRVIGFIVFEAFESPKEVAPVVRQLLDSPCGSYAASFLLEYGMASSDEVGAFINLTPLVDMLSTVMGDPEGFDELFRNAVDGIESDLIDDLWRHDQPETIMVLDAAGKHVTDKALAKAARSAANKHRSWLASQGR